MVAREDSNVISHHTNDQFRCYPMIKGDEEHTALECPTLSETSMAKDRCDGAGVDVSVRKHFRDICQSSRSRESAGDDDLETLATSSYSSDEIVVEEVKLRRNENVRDDSRRKRCGIGSVIKKGKSQLRKQAKKFLPCIRNPKRKTSPAYSSDKTYSDINREPVKSSDSSVTSKGANSPQTSKESSSSTLQTSIDSTEKSMEGSKNTPKEESFSSLQTSIDAAVKSTEEFKSTPKESSFGTLQTSINSAEKSTEESKSIPNQTTDDVLVRTDHFREMSSSDVQGSEKADDEFNSDCSVDEKKKNVEKSGSNKSECNFSLGNNAEGDMEESKSTPDRTEYDALARANNLFKRNGRGTEKMDREILSSCSHDRKKNKGDLLHASMSDSNYILPYLINIYPARDADEEGKDFSRSEDDYSMDSEGTECVLPHTPSNRSQRSNDSAHDRHALSRPTAFPLENAEYTNEESTGEASGDDVQSEESNEAKEDEDSEHKDDPWSAAKRGDVGAITIFSQSPSMDWTREDAFESTPLYYACHSGAAVGKDGLKTVKLLLTLWPGPIPQDILDRCKKNAINHDVVKLINRAADPLALQAGNSDSQSLVQDEEDEMSVGDIGWGCLQNLMGDHGAGDY